MSYQPGIPTGLVNLDEDYQNIQGNFQALDTVFGVDHVQFSNATAQKGYHTLIHFNPVSTTVTNAPDNQPVSIPPAVTAGYGQLFSAQINDGLATDEVLYWRSGGGRLTQLIRNKEPIADSSGFSYLAGPGAGAAGKYGAIIIQWGVNNVSQGASNNINFPTAFPNNCFNVQITLNRGSSTSSTSYGIVLNGAPTTTGFVVNSSFASTHPLYWVAIGN